MSWNRLEFLGILKNSNSNSIFSGNSVRKGFQAKSRDERRLEVYFEDYASENTTNKTSRKVKNRI